VVARFLWPALIILAVIVAVVVSAAGEQTRTELEYLDEMRAQASALARGGSLIGDVMARISEIGRDEFTTAFESVKANVDVAQEFVAVEPPTESLIPVWALYRQSVTAWGNGVIGLEASILQAADDPLDNTAIDAVADALADLRAGDSLFEHLQAEFQGDHIPEPVSPLVDVRLSPSDVGLFSLSGSYVAAARRSTNQLGLRPGLKVSQVISAPAWQINVDGQAVIPATETVTFSTVITNSGNVASPPESVTLEIDDLGEELIISQEEVPPLQPDGQVTIEFHEVALLADHVYVVRVRLELANPDSDLTDNELSIQFTVNAP
jgi:hypothetical protein